MKNVVNRASIGAKKNLSNRAFELGKAKELRSVVAHTMRLAMLVVLLLTIGVGKMWGNYTPGSGYTKVTNPSLQLGQYDQIILYEEATGMAVTGSDGTDATLSATEASWTIFNIQAISGSNVELYDVSSTIHARPLQADGYSAPYDFVFGTSYAETFTISSSGLLQYDGTRLAHNGNNVRFYSIAGTPLYVYKLDTPNPLTPATNAGLSIGPAAIYVSGKAETTFNSGHISYETNGYKNVQHRMFITDDNDFDEGMSMNFYYENDVYWSGYITPASTYDIDVFYISIYAPTPGVFHGTLRFIEYGTNNYVEVPLVITVTADCTPRTLSFDNGTSVKTLNKVDNGGMTYTNAATKSTGTGTISYGISNVTPAGCASVNSSGVVTFSEYGSATITASLGADGNYCAAADISYNISMSCKSRTGSVTFASSTPSVAVSTNTYQQTASVGTGGGTVTYALNQTSGSGWTINTSDGTVSFNGNAGTGTITATAAEDNTGYCEESGSYTLTVTPVVPTVSTFTPSSTENSITMTGSQVTNKGGSAITRYGYIYSTTLSTPATLVYGASGATDANVGTNDIALNTGFDKTVTGLSSGNTYYVRAYATNAAGTGYSDIQTISTVTYGEYVFSCAELEFTGPTGDLVFITSTAGKKVRSQEAFHLTGSSLTPSTAFTFSFGNAGLNELFEFKLATGGDIQTDGNGDIDADIYVYYTPAAGSTTDGLDKATLLTAMVGGTKPRTVTLNTKTIIGRHLPAQFVIAGKKDNKWWALPSNMASTSTPAPVEIAVNDINNPSVAYTAASNIYGLEGPTTSGSGNNISTGNGQYIRFTMSIEDGHGTGNPAPLFGTSGAEDASNSPKIGKSGTAIATNNLSEGWWWKLAQTNTNTSMTNPQEAKYNIYCANNTTNHLRIKDNAGNPEWGLYASGVEELRLIPASDIPYTEAYFVEWGRYGGVIEVDAANAGGTGQAATSVVAHLGEATSSAITLSQTLTASKGGATKYNYTVNFGSGIDFAASTSKGALLVLDWKNGETIKAKTSIVVPKIIASSSTLSSHGASDGDWSSAEVHVLPGVTLTVNAGDFASKDVTIDQLEIYPNATVIVTKGAQDVGTLDVRKLILRNGWTRVGEKRFDVARLYITPTTANLTKSNNTDGWYLDWYIDYDLYYTMSVPWKVATSGITYRNTNSTANTNSVKIRYYDGKNRAETGQDQIGQNWKDYNPWPEYLVPSEGYAISAKRPTGKAFSIVRMPLTFPGAAWTAGGEKGYVESTHKDQVSVTGWGIGTSTPWYAAGWNFIGNPYMATFNGDDDGISGKLELQNGGSIKYATIPDVGFKNYDQVAIADANISPASGFFIQANDADPQNITFSSSKIVPPSAPALYKAKAEVVPDQEAYIRLSYEGGKDQMGLIIGEEYTEAYEPNADLAKVLGEDGYVKTYMNYGGMDMAYVAINETLAKEWIPVTVKIPADGEYTFSLMNSSTVEELDGVFLIDYANENTITNLIGNDYVFTAEEGTITDRFAINAIFGEREVPTVIDAVETSAIDSDKPIKFLYHEKVFILYRGVIYDAVGKKVREINK